MRWTVHGEKPLYEDEWLDIRLADVELPDGRHLEHRLIRTPAGAGCVTIRDEQVLLLWRHRFITDTWGWESTTRRHPRADQPRRDLHRHHPRRAALHAHGPATRKLKPERRDMLKMTWATRSSCGPSGSTITR
jgi:hypothetical protein